MWITAQHFEEAEAGWNSSNWPSVKACYSLESPERSVMQLRNFLHQIGLLVFACLLTDAGGLIVGSARAMQMGLNYPEEQLNSRKERQQAEIIHASVPA